MLSEAREKLKRARYVVAFSGAGLSAESGLPTFRDTETDALWARFDPTELASIAGFEANPARVLDWYCWRRSRYSNVAPNPAHRALAAQNDLINITQNVDNLLEQAGATSNHVLHLHGTIVKDRCHARCGYEEQIDLQDPPPLRRCPRCDDYMRPAVVWFGETLPPDVWNAAEVACRRADCLLVIGTSATVYPAAGLVDLVAANGGEIIAVNTQHDEAHGDDALQLIGPAGELVPELLQGIDINSR